MFSCPVARFLWVFLRDILALGSIPSSVAELETILLSRKNRFQPILLFILAGAMWAIWKPRNDLVFEDKVLASPTVIIHKTSAFLAHWKKLLGEKKQRQVETVLAEIDGAAPRPPKPWLLSVLVCLPFLLICSLTFGRVASWCRGI